MIVDRAVVFISTRMNDWHVLIDVPNFFQAAHAVLEMQENGKPIHKVKNESLNALCDLYGSSINPIKDQLKAVYRKDPRFWARRPLSADMVVYAAADVLCLVPEIYLAMKR